MPPNAGPIAREMLTPRLLSATAGRSSGFGTSSGTIDCQAGAASAAPMPLTKVSASSEIGVIHPIQVSTPSATLTSASPIWIVIINRRRSTMSASAPAGSASRNTGNVVAACTSATIVGDGARLVISQPEAVSRIQVPMLAATVASHRIRKTRSRRGEKAPGMGDEEGFMRLPADLQG